MGREYVEVWDEVEVLIRASNGRRGNDIYSFITLLSLFQGYYVKFAFVLIILYTSPN
jgi:hypothetical protein